LDWEGKYGSKKEDMIWEGKYNFWKKVMVRKDSIVWLRRYG